MGKGFFPALHRQSRDQTSGTFDPREDGHGKDHEKADTEVSSEESRKWPRLFCVHAERTQGQCEIKTKPNQKQVLTEDPQKLRYK